MQLSFFFITIGFEIFCFINVAASAGVTSDVVKSENLSCSSFYGVGKVRLNQVVDGKLVAM